MAMENHVFQHFCALKKTGFNRFLPNSENDVSCDPILKFLNNFQFSNVVDDDDQYSVRFELVFFSVLTKKKTHKFHGIFTIKMNKHKTFTERSR